jgi:hypothetical protein
MSDRIFTCKDLEDNEVTINYKAVLSAYDQEKIDEVYMSNLVYNFETKKPEPAQNENMMLLPAKRQAAILENVIKSWSRTEPVTPENIKKALSRETYSKLVEELEEIVTQGEVDDSKKKNSPEN